MYYQNAKCAVVNFDLTNRESFMKVNDWNSEHQNATRDMVIVICDTKCDLGDQREASELAAGFGVPYVEKFAKKIGDVLRSHASMPD
jgi:GTPase SAR1 family protein